MQATIEVVDTQVTMFDTYGRCIPSVSMQKPAFAKSRRYFSLQQPVLDYHAIYERLVTYLGIGGVSELVFQSRVNAILEGLRADPATANIAQGVYVPFMLPKQELADIGSQMEQVYLPAVKAAFERAFPDKSFTNHHKDGLSGKLSIAVDSRHEHLLDVQQQQVQVGVYFPSLMEYSVPAAIERVASLPTKFMLAGGYDTAAALVAAPELLLRSDGYPPVLWLAALDAEKNGVNYLFEAYGYHLTFNRKPHFDQAAESWTSGLVVLG